MKLTNKWTRFDPSRISSAEPKSAELLTIDQQQDE